MSIVIEEGEEDVHAGGEEDEDTGGVSSIRTLVVFGDRETGGIGSCGHIWHIWPIISRQRIFNKLVGQICFKRQLENHP